MDFGSFLVSDAQSAKLVEPSERPLDDPAPSAQSAAMFGVALGEPSALIPTNVLAPANIELDSMRVGTGRDDKVVLKLALIAVVNQVDAGVNAFVLHLRVVRDIGAPLLWIVADEVVALAKQFIRASHLGCGVGFHQF